MKLLELEKGLEIWKVQLDALIEQDVNARHMSEDQFRRLQATIGRDKRLESLPFCALTQKGLEIISGHHRTRTARAAGLGEIFVLVDVTGLSPEQIAAKQLAHNSLAGKDDAQLVAEIFRKIVTADLQLEAYVPELSVKPAKVEVGDVVIPFEYKNVALVFLPVVEGKLLLAVESLRAHCDRSDALWLALEGDFDAVKAALHRVIGDYEIRILGNALGKMAELAQAAMGESVEDGESVPLRDIFGAAYVPKATADLLRAALDREDLPKKDGWKAIERWAAQASAKRPS